jgi:peptidoglycan/xylan/chitin deacetylase (PgdA/CDA1 family)
MKARLKQLAFEFARRSGCSRLVLKSNWRRQRLLILCYHGTSIDDEHHWDPQLYMAPAQLRRRLELIRESGCAPLPLHEAIQQLYAGDLPPGAVAVTYDDGAYDFYARAFPLLREFELPSTVYLTTYYVTHPGPVFDTMCSYLLWKARLDAAARRDRRRQIDERVTREAMDGAAKGRLLEALAGELGVDYRRLLDLRLLQLMSPSEVAALARQGVDFQLHTHRHAVSMRKETFEREIRDNREVLEPLRGTPANHFCYPSGAFRAEFPAWLRGWGVTSATTCDPGLATRQTEPLLIPRFVDTTHKTEAEFSAWLSGLAGLLPARSYADVPARIL